MSDDLNLGTPAGGETPAPAAAPATSTTNAAPPATPAAAPAPATPGAPPEGFVPSYRLREAREKAVQEAQSQWSQKEVAYQQQLEAIQRQLHALVGVTPPANPEVDQVRQQFRSLYPGLDAIEQRAQDLLGILERSGDLEKQNDHYWQSYGRQTIDRLFSHAAESLGGPLSDDAKRTLHASFVGYVQSSPEITERYTSDPTLVQDFWKAFSSGFIDPVRRAAAAGTANRAPGALPQDTPGGAPRTTPAPKLGGLDDRVAAAWATYQQNAKR